MNEQSSRSHTVFTLHITTKLPGQSRQSCVMRLVDLAGSENVKDTGVDNLGMTEASRTVTQSMHSYTWPSFLSLSLSGKNSKSRYRNLKRATKFRWLHFF